MPSSPDRRQHVGLWGERDYSISKLRWFAPLNDSSELLDVFLVVVGHEAGLDYAAAGAGMDELDVSLFYLGDHAGVPPLFAFLLELEVHDIAFAEAAPAFGVADFALLFGGAGEFDVNDGIALLDEAGAVDAAFGVAAVSVGGADVGAGLPDYSANFFLFFSCLGLENQTGRGRGVR